MEKKNNAPAARIIVNRLFEETKYIKAIVMKLKAVNIAPQIDHHCTKLEKNRNRDPNNGIQNLFLVKSLNNRKELSTNKITP